MTGSFPVTASAPGSLMLLGEHAVLHGRRALVCAINKRITVSVFQCSENVVRIFSNLGTYESPLDNLADHPDFRFVLDAIRQYPPDPSFAKGFGGHGQGIELRIDSEFSSDIGFGSSAAVTVATHAALMNFPRSRTSATKDDCRAGAETPPLDRMELFKRSLATIHRVQGRGSGADVAASVFGGVVAYRAESFENPQGRPLEIVLLKESFPLTAVYSGSKMKTADVIRLVEERRALNPETYEKIFDRMDASVGEVVEDFPTLGKNLIRNQKLMEEMGLCNDALTEIIRIFKSLPAPSGAEGETPAKISGSGLGDCVVALGKFSAFAKATADKPNIGGFPAYPLEVSREGVCFKSGS